MRLVWLVVDDYRHAFKAAGGLMVETDKKLQLACFHSRPAALIYNTDAQTVNRRDHLRPPLTMHSSHTHLSSLLLSHADPSVLSGYGKESSCF